MRTDLATHFAQARALPHSSQRLVNLYAEQGDGKDRVVLYGTPGLKSFATVGSGPIRGIHEIVGLAYVVSGSAVYSLTSGGTATLIPGVPVDGSGPVFMADNGTQLVIVTDQTTGYLVTTTVQQITDSDFPGASSVAFLDGYHVYTRPDSQAFFVSNLNAGGTITGTDFASAESYADNLVTCTVAARNLWLFGTRTTEVWFNAGQSGFPLARRTTLDRGIIGSRAAVASDNTVLWMGEDKIIYRNEGFVPMRISTHAIEEVLRANTVTDAQAWTYSQGGHRFIGWTLPTAGRCFVYDAATGLWHERESFDLPRWRPSCLYEIYGKVLAGDYNGSTVWELDLDTYTEASGAIQRVMTSPFLFNEFQRGTVHTFALDIEAGVGSDPQAMLRHSKDGGRTWSAELWRSFGSTGEYGKRAIWRRLGQFGSKGLVVEVTISDAVKVAVMGAYIEAEGNAL